VAGSYQYVRVLAEGFGIVYTFYNEKYGYTVYFNEYVYKDLVENCEFLSLGSYSFGFFHSDLNPDLKKKGDPIIGETISLIVQDFFNTEGENSIILFHCDGIDSMGLHRHKTFSRWYKNSTINTTITMYQIEVEVGGESHYLGFLCHNNNTHIPEIKQEFDTIAASLTPDGQKGNGH